MSDLEQRAVEYRELVTAEMRAVIGDAPDRLFAWMRYHLGWEDTEGVPVHASPGKMIRPVGLLLATKLCGGDVDRAIPAAAAIELVHNFSLLHDDVEDLSNRRRDRPTLWTFTSEAQAINTGDGMFTLARMAMLNLQTRGVSPELTLRAVRELDDASIRLVHGQYLDISFEQRQDVTLDEYITMASGKTAAMFAAPLAIGAIVAGASEATVEAFRTAGRHIGLGFQMVDDVLGIWGDPTVTGKPVGDDIRSRKMTYPVISALEHDPARLKALYIMPSSGEKQIEVISTLIEEGGGRDVTEQRAREERDRALAVLKDSGIAGDGIEYLNAYASVAIGRVS
jgi:geranylgeranyl diphosphate synthase type I